MFRWNDPDIDTFLTKPQTAAAALTDQWKHCQRCGSVWEVFNLFYSFTLFKTFFFFFFFSSFLFFYIFQHTVSWLFHISIFTRFLLSTYGTPQLSIALTARTQWYFAVWNWFDRQINCSWMSLCSRVMRLSLIILFDLFAACSCQIVFLPLHGTSVGMIAAEQDSEHGAHLEAGGGSQRALMRSRRRPHVR